MCTDSSALLSPAEAARLGVAVASVAVAVDGVPWNGREGTNAFYEQLASGATATTAPPSPGELLALYDELAREGADEVLSIHLDRRLSGTADAAELAAHGASPAVRVVEVATASFGVALCVRAAVGALHVGATAVDAEKEARAVASRLRNAFVAPTATGGRVPTDRGCAVLELADGTTGVLATADSLEAATGAMAELVEADGATQAAVGHAAEHMRPSADALARQLCSLVAVERYRIAPAVGAHIGGASFGLFWWSEA